MSMQADHEQIYFIIYTESSSPYTNTVCNMEDTKIQTASEGAKIIDINYTDGRHHSTKLLLRLQNDKIRIISASS